MDHGHPSGRRNLAIGGRWVDGSSSGRLGQRASKRDHLEPLAGDGALLLALVRQRTHLVILLPVVYAAVLSLLFPARGGSIRMPAVFDKVSLVAGVVPGPPGGDMETSRSMCTRCSQHHRDLRNTALVPEAVGTAPLGLSAVVGRMSLVPRHRVCRLYRQLGASRRPDKDQLGDLRVQ